MDGRPAPTIGVEHCANGPDELTTLDRLRQALANVDVAPLERVVGLSGRPTAPRAVAATSHESPASESNRVPKLARRPCRQRSRRGDPRHRRIRASGSGPYRSAAADRAWSLRAPGPRASGRMSTPARVAGHEQSMQTRGGPPRASLGIRRCRRLVGGLQTNVEMERAAVHAIAFDPDATAHQRY